MRSLLKTAIIFNLIKLFTFNKFFNDLFHKKQRILISFYHNIEISIIDTKLQIFINFHCE